MLKRGIEVIVGAALTVAVMLAVAPAIAQAQEQEARSAKREASAPASVVVRPGDSLWSISEERLGPGATLQQIAGEVERIYTLNRDQIGPDPNLIFPGQRFSLPPGGKKPSAQAPATAHAANEAVQGKPAQASSLAGRAAKSETAQDSRATARGKTSAKTAKATRPVGGPEAERVILPNAPEATPVPAAKPLSSNEASRSPLASFLESVRSAATSAVRSAAEASDRVFAEAPKSAPDRRWLLGWGIIALSLLVGALMAWKLPMRRHTGDEKEVWGIYTGYPAGDYPSYPRGLDRRGDKSASVQVGSEPYPGTPAGETRSTQNGASRGGLEGIAQVKRRTIRNRRARRLRPFPRKGLATGAHAPKVRRSLLRSAPRSVPRGSRARTAAFVHTKAKTTRR
jgi:hypothetical protein